LLPKLTDLAAPHQQRTDELAERLRQSLRQRINRAQIALTGPAQMLSPRLLVRQVDQGQQRLSALTRLAESLHPEAPLMRGFARVTDSSGKTIMNRDAAIAAGRVGLRFADGEVGALVDGGKPIPKPTPRNPPTVTNQGNLFGG
jgi:exodeoxyribonuclease VII large subunit